MNYDIENSINEVSDEYELIVKNKQNILNELNIVNEDEYYIYDSIISGIEKIASREIKNMKTVQLPFIGCLRINPIKRELRNAKLHLSAIRKSLSKEQYKDHVRSYVVDLKIKQAEKDRLKLILNRIKSNNKKRYDFLYRNCGRAYAELFIKSIYWLKEVPFSQEFEDLYNSI